MGGQIVPASRFVRPVGPGSPSRLVEVDGKLDLALDRQGGSVFSSEPFGETPVATRVVPEVLGVEHRHRHNPRSMALPMVPWAHLESGDAWREVGRTRAWCRQKGCMLQWIPGSNRRIVCNDRDGDRFGSRIRDL